MVGNHPVRSGVVTFGLHPGKAFRGRNQRLERVGVVIVMDALHDGGDAFEAHTGVN